VVFFVIDVKRGRRDLKFSINAKGGVCWQELQFAQFAHLFLSLMSNFKNAKGTGMDQFAQWISLHRHGGSKFGDQHASRHTETRNCEEPGVSISGFREFVFRDSGSFYFRIFAW
jgi:hypothetical protein